MRREEDRAARFARRAVTIPLYGLLAALLLPALPLWLLIALAVDAARGDASRLLTRLVFFAAIYLLCELGGLLAALGLTLWAAASRAPRERFLDWNFRLQCHWARALFASATRVFRLGIDVEGDELVGARPGLVFARHASLVDVLLPAVLVADRHGHRLRWVLKRELLADPCLDVVGNRLPNVFIRRDSSQTEREVAAVARLAREAGPGEGVLIYPEGTRATQTKRARVMARLAERATPERLARLRGLRHLLPPRLGGPLALLAARPDLDVILLGHVGLEGLATLRDLVRQGLVGRRVRVRFWRCAAADRPSDDEARAAWLDARWLELDGWVDEALAVERATA